MKITVGQLRKAIREEALREGKAPRKFNDFTAILPGWKGMTKKTLSFPMPLVFKGESSVMELRSIDDIDDVKMKVTVHGPNKDQKLFMSEFFKNYAPVGADTRYVPTPKVNYITRGKGSPISGMEDVTDVRVESLGDNVTKTEVSTDGGQNWVIEPLGIGFIVKLTSVKGWTFRS